MSNPNSIPDPPSFSPELLTQCRRSGDYRPIFFEWYKFVGVLSNVLASVERESPALRTIPPVHHATLIGLMNRNARLMLANIALFCEGSFGETTAILDRCIFETCVKLSWLCSQAHADAFERFIADGLKTELELEAEINANIAKRGGVVLEIERRMVRSTARAITSAGLTREQIADSRKLPNVASMIDALGRSRLMYVVGQRLGSHHVHGTWVSLITHYLEPDDSGTLVPRDADCDTHVNQFMYVPLIVLESLRSFVQFAITDGETKSGLVELLESTSEAIMKFAHEDAGADFDPVEGE